MTDTTERIPLTLQSKNHSYRVTVGWLIRQPNGFFRLVKTGLSWSRHHMRKPSGWAIAAEHIDTLKTYGGGAIELYTEEGYKWSVDWVTWCKHAIPHQTATATGYERQMLLPDRFWTRGKGEDEPAVDDGSQVDESVDWTQATLPGVDIGTHYDTKGKRRRRRRS